MEWRYSKKIKKRIEKGKLSKDELKAIEKAKEIIEACRDINEFRQHHKVRKMKGSKYEYYRIKVQDKGFPPLEGDMPRGWEYRHHNGGWTAKRR